VRSAFRRLQRDDDGQVFVLFALLLGTFMLVFALVVNIGLWFATDAGLQKAADAAALAAEEYQGLSASNQAPQSIIAACNTAATADDCAYAIASANGVAHADTHPRSTTWNSLPAYQVTVDDHNTSYFMAGFLGFGDTVRHAAATAVVAPLSGAAGALPMVVTSRDAAGFSSGQQVTLGFGTSPSPGSFGLLHLCSGNGTSAEAACISCAQTYSWPGLQAQPLPSGCSAVPQTCATATYPAETGSSFNSQQIGSAFNSLSGKVVLVPVFVYPSGESGTGNNATYTITGYVALLVGSFSKSTNQLTGTFEGFVDPSSGAHGGCTGIGGFFGAGEVKLVA